MTENDTLELQAEISRQEQEYDRAFRMRERAVLPEIADALQEEVLVTECLQCGYEVCRCGWFD